MQARDIIVTGSSLGGVAALGALVEQLPASLPAAVLVVQHMSAESPGVLAELLAQRTSLPVVVATDGMRAERGRIHVAPPDRHMLMTAEGLRIAHGPRENRARPAIDPLFRSVAVHCRSRAVGVILTGLQGDGSAGLRAVWRCGGAAVVQAPADAAHPEMPQRALSAVPAAQQAPLAELGALLVRLVAAPAPAPPPVPESLELEVRLTERVMTSQDDWGEVPSQATDFTCPECSGALRLVGDDEAGPRYRCRVGHAYSGDALIAAKDERLEETLWVALQTLQERTQMLETLAASDRQRGWTRSAETYQDRARETREHADRLRTLIHTLALDPTGEHSPG